MFESGLVQDRAKQSAWWCEREVAIILFLGLVTFCTRLDALPLFGEEPRRAQIAREMVESGDWLVPGTQRVFLPSRPPLQNWLIAIAGMVTGSFDVWSVRIPSILSTFAMALLIYGYMRQQFGKLGSLTGSCSFLTMTLVMEFGRSAETEAVFSLFVSASLLVWHWAWIKKWPEWQIWSIGYFLVALGMLTKGLQSPLYFVGATWLFLLMTGNRKAILTRGQFMGIAVFLAVFGAWQGPFTWHRGLFDTWLIYFEDVKGRFADKNWSRFLEHLVVFPAELVFVRMMPWSILLLAYGSRRVRNLLHDRRETVTFLAICILFSFVTVWLPTKCKVRYFMPLFPCLAVLIGIAVDRVAMLREETAPHDLWTSYVKFMTYLIAGASVGVVAVSLALPSWRFSLPNTEAIGFAATALILGCIARNSLNEFSDRAMARGAISLAMFLALVQVGLIVTVQQRRCEDIAGQIEELKTLLPSETVLVSLGPVHHAFAFFYQQPIPIVPIPRKTNSNKIDYFCVHTCDQDPPLLPFNWTQVAVVSCDRFKSDSTPKDRVFVGRRLPTEEIGLTSTRERHD